MKIAMVSGANRGIGLAISRALASAGFGLSLGVRDPDKVPSDIAASARLIHRYDACNPKAGRNWVDATLSACGRIDVLVNNAGIADHLALMEEPALSDREAEEALDRLLTVNVKAPFMLSRAALPALCENGSGRVITLASMSGKRVLGLNAGYQMTKHAAVALSNAIRRAGWDRGVRATAVCPGFVATEMASHYDSLDMQEVTQPEDLAKLVVELVQLPNSASVAELQVNWRYEPVP